MKRRAAALISGRGSNMLALLNAAAEPAYPAAFVRVISNREDAPGLAAAEAVGVPTTVVSHLPFGRDRASHEAAIEAVLKADGVEYVCLAGYMRRLSPFLVERFRGRMLNVHPSLLPAFPGLQTHARALASGVRLHGCTVHVVTESVDDGPVMAQAAVPVFPDDTAETLADRVLAQEHTLYPVALAALIDPSRVAWPVGTAALRNPLPSVGPVP